MRDQVRPALVVLALMTLLTGAIYPVAVTALAQLIWPEQANGSVVFGEDGAPIGSVLIGQDFTAPGYFWGRPSATAGAPYTPFDRAALTGASGSNLGPLSAGLRDAAAARTAALRAADPTNPTPIPADLVTASASGLDPGISVAGALYQAPRVARARGLTEDAVRGLIDRHTEGRWWGIFGEPRVNVLALNQALDSLR